MQAGGILASISTSSEHDQIKLKIMESCLNQEPSGGYNEFWVGASDYDTWGTNGTITPSSSIRIGAQGNQMVTVRSIVSFYACLLYTSPSPRDLSTSRMPSSA